MREMDHDDERKAALIREFLRRKPVEEWFAGEIVRCRATPHLLHPTIKKSLFLRRLTGDLCSEFSDDTLQILELLELHDRASGAAAAPPRAMISAYCAVAVHLTVVPLRAASRGDVPDLSDFFGMVRSVWNGRVADLERSEGRGLVGDDLRDWRAKIQFAVTSNEVRGQLLRRDTKGEAREAVREYLRLAIYEMGPPLLELVASAASGEGAGQGGGKKHGPAASSGVSPERTVSSPTEAPPEDLPPVGHPAPASATDGSAHQVPDTASNKLERTVSSPTEAPPEDLPPVGHPAPASATDGSAHQVPDTAINQEKEAGAIGQEGAPPQKDLCPATPSGRTHTGLGRRGVSSSKSQENSPKLLGRRKTRWWTPEEEDALRGAVKKLGKGNWKFILQSYGEAFKGRTEVDLKDKWRNMTK